MLHARDHRLAVLADGVAAHHATLSALTGWTITPAAVTDDRLGRLLEVLGEDTSQITAVQQALGRHVISGLEGENEKCQTYASTIERSAI